MTACLYCIHPATTADRRGNPACAHCRDHVAPEMSDAVVSDLLQARHNGEHAPMTDASAERVDHAFATITGHPMDAICNLLSRTVLT